MALNINTNIGALGAAAAASSVNKSMETSMERLSTGLRINSAADDAAGMAITSRMESAVRGMNQAIRNAMDAQALIDTAEGAQSETMNLLQRMRELAVQAGNDTNSQQDRLALNEEIIQLSAEIERIATTTTWAGQKVLDGTFVTKNFQIGAFEGESLTISQESMKPADIGEFQADSTALVQPAAVDSTTVDGANAMATTALSVTGKNGTASAAFTATSSAKVVAAAVNADTALTGVEAKAHTALRFSLSGTPTSTVNFTIQGGGTGVAISASVADSNDLTNVLSAINTYSGTTGVTAEFDGSDKSKLIFREADGDNIRIADFTADATTTINATIEKQSNFVGTAFTTGVTLTGLHATPSSKTDSTLVTGVVRMSSTKDFVVSGDDTTSAATGYFATAGGANADLSKVSDISVSTRAGAESAIAVLDTAIQKVAESRASLGAVSNRLDSTVSNLTNIVGNTESSRARIEDADFAAESTNLAKSQILQQAATAMLAQANASKQGVLQLLQG